MLRDIVVSSRASWSDANPGKMPERRARRRPGRRLRSARCSPASARREHELRRRRRDHVDAGREQPFVVGDGAGAPFGSARGVDDAVGLQHEQCVASLVATTPIGPMPASSPASRPTFSGVWTHTPTSSRSGRRATARMAFEPTPPVDQTATRMDVIVHPRLLVVGSGEGERSAARSR